jgi:hypothetical protein
MEKIGLSTFLNKTPFTIVKLKSPFGLNPEKKLSFKVGLALNEAFNVHD